MSPGVRYIGSMSNSKANLLAELRARKEKEVKLAIDWNQRKKDWLEDLTKLFADITAWLHDGVQEGLIGLVPGSVNLTEEYIGDYEAPTLKIGMASEVVVLRPIGTLIIGAAGRVDATCRGKTAKLLRTSERTWKLRVASQPFGELIDLTDETFSDVLRELLQQ